MELLKQYFQLQKEIFEYFGYKEDWKIIPIEDNTDMYWVLEEWLSPHPGGIIRMYDEPITQDVLDSGQYYSHSIYTQRFLPKWVYRGKEYTMICADTHVDGNKILSVLDNGKEVSPTGLDLYSFERDHY